MCGRFTLTTETVELAKQFDLPGISTLSPRYNIAPTQQVAVIRQTEQGRALAMLRWGLIPSWAKDPAIGARMINARAETAAEKPAFRSALAQRRCLVLADGFYEWQKTNGHKQPYYIRMLDSKPFAFAGLWEQWTDPNGDALETCTILTTAPNDLLRLIHERMPVILQPDTYTLWLDPAIQERDLLTSLLSPYPSEHMQAYPISTRVNNVRNNDERCIEPIQVE